MVRFGFAYSKPSLCHNSLALLVSAADLSIGTFYNFFSQVGESVMASKEGYKPFNLFSGYGIGVGLGFGCGLGAASGVGGTGKFTAFYQPR